MLTIEVKDGKLFVTHGSGHFDIYNQSDYEKFLVDNLKEIEQIQQNVIYIEDIIKQMGGIKPVIDNDKIL